jgi:DNA-binding NarL/FixJ family response regulator
MSEIRVVLIEDHAVVRMGLRAALQSHANIQVVGETSNAIQGLALLQLWILVCLEWMGLR